MNTNVNEITNTESTATNGNGKTFSLQDVKKSYFSPDNLNDAVAYVSKVQTALADDPKATLVRNFADDEQFPDGYGLAVIPINKRKTDGTGNQVIGAAIAAIPDPGMVAEHEKGGDFIRDLIVDFFCAKIANVVRPREGAPAELNIPFSIEDFIENRRGNEGMKTWTELAPDYVKALRAKGLKFMTVPILRQTLQSAGFASQMFTKIGQEQWAVVLNAMIDDARKKGLDPAVLTNWLETRERNTGEVVEDVDFSDLAGMVEDEE